MEEFTSLIEEADAKKIQALLKQIWQEMNQAEDAQAVIRASVMNIVVVAETESAQQNILQAMAEISVDHPSRILVLFPNEENLVSTTAWVNALCQRAPGGRKQICNEQIVIRVPPRYAPHVPSLVRPLILPDLPVVLWWRHELNAQSALFIELLDSCDRLIFDSSIASLSQIKEVLQLIDSQGGWTAVSDLNWGRLTPWRMALSSFFDVPELRNALNEIREARIEVDASLQSSAGAAAFILASWLATRLKWQFVLARKDSHSIHIDFTSRGRHIGLSIRAVGTGGQGLQSVTFVSEQHGVFEVKLDEQSAFLLARAEVEGITAVNDVFHIAPFSETTLIAGELEILTKDPIYEEALEFAAAHFL